jgi:nucleotide-binding universal stress UspA family protein
MTSPGSPRDVIVVGVDGSAGADAALDHALRAGLDRGCPVELVTGWLWVGSSDGQSASELAQGRAAVQRVQAGVLERAAERLGAMPEVIQTVVHDYAGRVLVARAEGAMLLAVGAGSLGSTSTKMLGSVTEYCVRHSPVPVVVVPEPERVRRRHAVADVITLARTSDGPSALRRPFGPDGVVPADGTLEA